MRQTIALEARIAAGDIGGRRRHQVPGDRPAGRWPPGLDGHSLNQSSDAELNRMLSLGLLRDITERLEDDPEIEPEDIVAVADTLRRVCGDLGIDLDPSQEPDEWLEPDPPASLAPDPLSPRTLSPRTPSPGALAPGPGFIGWPSDPAAPHPNPHGPDPPLSSSARARVSSPTPVVPDARRSASRGAARPCEPCDPGSRAAAGAWASRSRLCAPLRVAWPG